MLGRILVSAAAFLLGSCTTTLPGTTTSPAPVSAYRPIDVTAAMKAGMTATRPFQLIYALEYATNRTDKAVPETFGGLSSMLFSSKVGSKLQFEIISDQGHFGLLDLPDAMLANPQLSGTSKVMMVPTRGPDGAVLLGSSNMD